MLFVIHEKYVYIAFNAYRIFASKMEMQCEREGRVGEKKLQTGCNKQCSRQHLYRND